MHVSFIGRIIFYTLVGFGVFIAISSEASAGYIVKNFEVRSAGGWAYASSIQAASTGSSLEFRIGIVTDGAEPSSMHRATLGLPAGLVATGYTPESVDCPAGNISSVNQTNNTFSFNFPAGAYCEVILVADYRTNGLTGTLFQPSVTVADSVDNVFLNGNDLLVSTNQLSLNISSLVSIQKATTRDTNGDGFIDRFDLTFNNPLPTSIPSSISVSSDSKVATWVTFSGAVGALTGTLTFSDGYLRSDETPHIVVSWDTFYASGDYFTEVVEDGAPPKISVSPAGWAFTASQSVTLTSNEGGALYYAFTGTANTGSNLYTSPFSIYSNTTLSIFTQDIWKNSQSKTYAFTFSCGNVAPTNGTISTYPSCVITCNTGYTLANSACTVTTVTTSGWGGGGGGSIIVGGKVDYCPSGDYSGNSNDGLCVAPANQNGWTNTGALSMSTGALSPVDKLSLSSLDLIYFTSASWATDYLITQTKDRRLQNLIRSFSAQLNFEDVAVYLATDHDFSLDYNRAVNTYALYILRSEDVRTGRAVPVARIEANKALLLLHAFLAKIPKLSSQYITVISSTGVSPAKIYRTKYTPLRSELLHTELHYIARFKRLLATGSIDTVTYQNAIANYNRYVLGKTILAEHGSFPAGETMVQDTLTVLNKLYATPLKVAFTPLLLPTSEIPIPTRVSDHFVFDKNLSFWMTDPDIGKLQSILKHYGYFDLAETNYFWTYTKKALIRFSQEQLHISNPSGIFDASVRNALSKLTW